MWYEMKAGIRRFWALPWRWKGSIVAGVAVVIVIISVAAGSGGGSKGSGSTRTALVQAKTATSTATATPKRTAALPTATPTPLSIEAQLKKSYEDNRGFMIRAVGDPVKVSFDPAAGTAEFDVYPKAIASEGDVLTIESASAIVASKAVWSSYPQVKEIIVATYLDFTNASGASRSEVAASTSILRATGNTFVYDGLKSRALSDNKLWFCGADAYNIHPAIYTKLGNPGCLAQWGMNKPFSNSTT